MKREFIYRPVSVSTNTELKNVIRGSAEPVTAVLRAGEQSGGRGRQNKVYFSPPGGVYFSAAFPLAGDETHVSVLTLLAGLAVCRALESACPARYRVKWPNDIYLYGKKLCGILTELVCAGPRMTAVVGIGINADIRKEAIPPALADVMTTLAAEGLRCPDAAALTRNIVSLLDHYVYDLRALAADPAPLIAEINARSCLTGRTVVADTGRETITGRVLGISPEGRLALETDRGITEIFSGTVREIGNS